MIEKMTYHEYYGNLPAKTMRLIRKYNVSPADFDMMTDAFGSAWAAIDKHIIDNSADGYYQPKFY